MTTGYYLRVSSKSQDTKSQEADMTAHAAREDGAVFYRDKFTGKSMNRPGWAKLWADVCAGKVDKIVVWRLDRLGRTVAGLSRLFEELQERRVDLISVRDGLSLNTPAGRLMAHVLASVAVYEIEVKAERQLAGIAAVRKELENGTATWRKGERAGMKRTRYGSGRKPGTRVKVTQEVERNIRLMTAAGTSVAEVARVLKLSRPTVYAVIRKPA
jgi:DNA invertase Pin-like site-specific DNA recombinase